MFLYPYISQWVYDGNVADTKTNFEKEAAGNNQQLEALYPVLVAENQRMFDEGQADLKYPFSFESPAIVLNEYGLSNNIIGIITIAKIGESLPIYLGASEENLKKGAVHLTGTSYPIGGENTNSVIGAHRGYRGAKMFRNIDELEIGDEIIIRDFRETKTYQVTETKVINPDEVDQILIEPGKDQVTLMSCHPYTKSEYRYLVYCERV